LKSWTNWHWEECLQQGYMASSCQDSLRMWCGKRKDP
jgi:hypothetical protein